MPSSLPDPARGPVYGREDLARLYGIHPNSVTRAASPSRRHLPEPDGRFGKSPWWYQSTIREHVRARKRAAADETAEKSGGDVEIPFPA